MIVSNIRVIRQSDFCELCADVRFQTHWVWGDAPFPLWYRYPVEYLSYLSSENGDPFFAALLPAAMRLNEPLHIEGAVSERLLSALPQIQSIYRCWNSDYRDVAVEARVRSASTSARSLVSNVGLFFSMGVDSSYTLCQNVQARGVAEPISHLIVVKGFDVYLWEEHRFPPFLAAVKRVAGALGKSVLPVTTNLRDFSDRVVDWLHAYHGPALVSVVLALSDAFHKVHISASQTYAQIRPGGTHPLLDPLWSTDHTSFVHVGLEATRSNKIAFLARSPVLINNLRVCSTGEITDAYNCGKCEKCLRTAIALHVEGVLDQCGTLPHKIDLGLVRKIQVDNDVARDTLSELRDALGESPEDVAIRDALVECLGRISP